VRRRKFQRLPDATGSPRDLPATMGTNSTVADRTGAPASMQLRPLTLEDRRLYERIYTDPRMWAELGGVLELDMAAKVERDVASVEADRHWVLVIVIDNGTAVGTVALWDHEWKGETIDEIGWMVLPEHQGRGLASAAVAEALRRADEAARWQVLHAFPATTNAPSNALCRKHGFALRGPIDSTYGEQSLRVNHWVRDRAPDVDVSSSALARRSTGAG
jgi:RimJ/RimL family protein N-acetyltransferase